MLMSWPTRAVQTWSLGHGGAIWPPFVCYRIQKNRKAEETLEGDITQIRAKGSTIIILAAEN